MVWGCAGLGTLVRCDRGLTRGRRGTA